MIKAAFFDIDGTLVCFKTHKIPESALSAMKQAREKGVKLFVATGRPRQFLSALSEIEPLIDGYITCNGAYCFIGECVLYQQGISQEQVMRIVEECRQLNRTCTVVGRDKIAEINVTSELLKIFCELLKIDVTKFRNPLEEVLVDEVFQVIPFISPEEETALLKETPDCIGLRWHPAFVDVTRRGTDKGNALRRVADAIGIDISETIAFGDGGNDIAMLQTAGIGVAMGNASDELKQHADFVTTSVDEDGIANAFKHLGII